MMKKLETELLRLARDQRGANLVEYLLLLSLIAIVILAAARSFGKTVSSKFNQKEGNVSAL
jgi:Flp pilus assembly pilin Flp